MTRMRGEDTNLIILLPHDEEDGVKEVHKLGEEVPPAHPQHSEGPGVLDGDDKNQCKAGTG